MLLKRPWRGHTYPASGTGIGHTQAAAHTPTPLLETGQPVPKARAHAPARGFFQNTPWCPRPQMCPLMREAGSAQPGIGLPSAINPLKCSWPAGLPLPLRSSVTVHYREMSLRAGSPVGDIACCSLPVSPGCVVPGRPPREASVGLHARVCATGSGLGL